MTSLQQRELTMQKKLYQTLTYVYDNISIQFTVPLPTNQSFTTTSSSTDVSLPELLNITRNCFDDILKWEDNIKLNRSRSVKIHEDDENEILTQRSLERSSGQLLGQREPMRRKPPTIPRR